MECLYIFGFLLSLFLAKSDATVTWTTPTVSGTAACPTMSTVAEGTVTGDLVTLSVTSSTTGLNKTLADTTTFALTGDVVSIASTADLNFESGASVNVLIVADDADTTPATATCTIALTDVAPWFDSYSSKIIIPASTAPTTAIQTLSCTDGGGSIGAYALTSGDDTATKFSFDIASGALTKSAIAFDATVKSSYILTFTCTDGTTMATATVTVCLNNESNCPSKASINNGILAGLIVPTLLAIYHLI